MLTIRNFVATYGASQLLLSLLGALGVSAAFSLHSHFCHQLADRSFHLDAAQFSLCARCMGVYLGLLLCAVLKSRLSQAAKRNLTLLMGTSFIIFAMEKFWLEPSNIEAGNFLRFPVGVGLGYCLAIVVFFLWNPSTDNPFRASAASKGSVNQ